MNVKTLEKVIALLQKHNVEHFKSQELELKFSPTTQKVQSIENNASVQDYAHNSGIMHKNDAKQDEELLFWSSN